MASITSLSRTLDKATASPVWRMRTAVVAIALLSAGLWIGIGYAVL